MAYYAREIFKKIVLAFLSYGVIRYDPMSGIEERADQRLSVMFTASQIEALDRIAKKRDRPKGYLIKQAVDEWLERQKDA